ncbi:hypothetical protein ILUMI_25643 [Ignelater luminosus]|uniref:Cupin-like domain-containing protein n=1 Tax=Ignelater luminosus TaxID=2038154 RepID=A0A8K0FW65_IGNLU|nr:hypothetical protein ILUMI_25643 [Ignelater luminosus]
MYRTVIASKYNYKLQDKSSNALHHLICLCVLLIHFTYMFWLSYNPADKCLIQTPNLIKHLVRPIDSCSYCKALSQPKVFGNLTQKKFKKHAYKSHPLVLKNAVNHWPAKQIFDVQFFKRLYQKYENALLYNYYEGCNYFSYDSGIPSLESFFAKIDTIDSNEIKKVSWYVGWGNCDPDVLAEMRKYYPKPHFLPDDAETPSKEYVFMGYDAGATMHLDFINRLMWQAQLKGTKTWYLKPSPECEDVCQSLSFLVEPGDAVLVDTRVWYHGTTITPGEFSLAIQSEYG